MKDTKFIELLNLYLDQQIEPADAAMLEEEIARNPARRTTYQQYCRMHRACTMMFEQSHPSSEVGVKVAMTAAAAEEKIMAFPTSRRNHAWVGYGMGLAAAACVAFVFVQRSLNPQTAPTAPDVIVQIAPAPAVARPDGLIVPVDYQPTAQFARSARKVAPAIEGQPSLEWMRQVQFTPMMQVSATEMTFDQQSTAPADQGVFHSRLPIESTAASAKMELMNGGVEKAAWQFQK